MFLLRDNSVAWFRSVNFPQSPTNKTIKETVTKTRLFFRENEHQTANEISFDTKRSLNALFVVKTEIGIYFFFEKGNISKMDLYKVDLYRLVHVGKRGFHGT